MKIPLTKLGMVDIELKNIPRKAWIIIAWAVFILSVGAAISLAKWGGIRISYNSSQHGPRAGAVFYDKELHIK